VIILAVNMNDFLYSFLELKPEVCGDVVTHRQNQIINLWHTLVRGLEFVLQEIMDFK